MNQAIKNTSALLLFSLSVISHAGEIQSPVDAANLYIRTVVNHDENSTQQLNDYLRADRLRSGRSADYADFKALKEADAVFPEQVAKLALPLFPKVLREELKAPLENLMGAVQQARLKTDCKALSSDEPSLSSRGVLNTTVSFECKLAKINETWAQGIKRMAAAQYSAENIIAELQKLQADYSATPSDVYRGVFTLGMVPKDKNEAWRNDFAREPFDEMFKQF